MRWGFSLVMAAMAALIVVVAVNRSRPVPLLTVDRLVAEHDKWDGRKVRVQGWLSDCRGYNCSISSRPIRDHERELVEGTLPPHLTIGESAAFDAAAARLTKRHVVVTARFSAKCLRPTFKCFDRASELTPIGGGDALQAVH